MAPASSAGATPAATRGRRRWDRAQIIEAIAEWVTLYGEPPRAADWNPSAARWAGALWRIERYRHGRGDGTPWPSLNAAKRPFGGSLTAALTAAGYPPTARGGGVASVAPSPAGPDELAAALRRVARARSEADAAATRAALTAVAEAAIGWRDRV